MMKDSIINLPTFVNLTAMVFLAFAAIWVFQVILSHEEDSKNG